MSSEFSALEVVYEKVIDLMPARFDSHEFILKLAQKYQRLYAQALAENVENEKPFQIVNSQIAMRLLKFPDVVARVGEHISVDMFLQERSATIWQKVGA